MGFKMLLFTYHLSAKANVNASVFSPSLKGHGFTVKDFQVLYFVLSIFVLSKHYLLIANQWRQNEIAIAAYKNLTNHCAHKWVIAQVLTEQKQVSQQVSFALQIVRYVCRNFAGSHYNTSGKML